LDWSERETHAEVLALHRDLIRLRKSDPIFSRQDRNFDGAVLSRDSFILRFFSQDFRDDRLLVINLGREINFSPSPEPLLAPPANSEWQLLWSSDHPKYGGDSTAPLDSDLNWVIPARCAAALKATRKEEGTTN
jgi:maltooligosyltrehalose trehalohydrolase